MGKKKSGGDKTKKSSSRILAGFVVVIAIALSGVYVATKPPVVPVAPATGQLIEKRPVLSPALFTGKVAEAYRVAAEIPKVLDAQFCYCHCKKEKGHKNLLTCFTSRHGSKCETCINEALYAHELYKQGKTIDEIVVAVDRKFYRPYRKSSPL